MNDESTLNEAQVSQVADLMESEQFANALEAYAGRLPDPTEFLREQGLELPSDTEMTVRLHRGSGIGTERHKERVCWEICVGPPFAKVCREKCVWK